MTPHRECLELDLSGGVVTGNNGSLEKVAEDGPSPTPPPVPRKQKRLAGQVCVCACVVAHYSGPITIPKARVRHD